MITNANTCVIRKPRFWHSGMKNDASFNFSQGLRNELPNANNGDMFSNSIFKKFNTTSPNALKPSQCTPPPQELSKKTNNAI
jgi:hypothetical protein